MKIPVFVSRPSNVSDQQQISLDLVLAELDAQRLEPRLLGQSDYPTNLPLRDVLSIAHHCAGGVVLGFKQFEAESGIWKEGTDKKRIQETPVKFPTPWNHLEAGVMYALQLPLLIFREPGIEGGIFDIGSSEAFVNEMPVGKLSEKQAEGLRHLFITWAARVRQRYYKIN
jgi:hypothetical protein